MSNYSNRVVIIKVATPAGRVAAAMGAAILSKAVFAQNHHVNKVEYDEYGPSIIHKKCFT